MGKFLSHPLTILISTLIAVGFTVSAQQTLKNYQKTSQAIQEMERQNQELGRELISLEQQAELSQSDFAKEKVIRDELLRQKEGEYVLQLPENLPAPPTPTPSPTSKPIEEWKQLIFN